MPRLTNINDVLFPVDEHPVFISVTDKGAERRLTVPEKKALVNRNSNRVLGIVSRGYRLVTNQEALDLAYKCCRTIFPETLPGEWGVNAINAPSTAGYCHIDLVHNSAALNFSFVPANQRPEVFGPFIRVTNSFNGLRALGFDIGFYRKVCKNGVSAKLKCPLGTHARALRKRYGRRYVIGLAAPPTKVGGCRPPCWRQGP